MHRQSKVYYNPDLGNLEGSLNLSPLAYHDKKVQEEYEHFFPDEHHGPTHMRESRQPYTFQTLLPNFTATIHTATVHAIATLLSLYTFLGGAKPIQKTEPEYKSPTTKEQTLDKLL